MLRKLISVYKLSLIASLISIVLIISIDMLLPNPYALLLQSIVVLSVFVGYRTFSASVLNAYIKKSQKELHSIFPSDINAFFEENNFLGLMYNAPKIFKNIFLNIESIYKIQSDLTQEINTLNISLEQNIKTKDFLLEISNSILEFDNQLDFLNFILEKTIEIIPDASHGCVIRNADDKITEYIASYGYKLNDLQTINLDLSETFIYVMSNGDIKEPKISGNLRTFNKEHIESEKYESFDDMNAYDVLSSVSSPIFINNKLYGMLNIDSEKENAFSEEIVPVMKYISNQISIALNNYIMYEKTVELSKYDSLTGIFNRSYFENLFADYYKKALRYNESFIISLVDMNNLKKVNDLHGHSAGDKALKILVGIINENIRESDIFARYGGDEFIIVFFNTTKQEVEEKLDFMLKKAENHHLAFDNQAIKLSFSYGLAVFPEDSTLSNILIKKADIRMYI
ncbi:MAG: sensor domain-containing diguanylate cyclase, partial [Bacillota bacterium]|nr:sensor domain-containing diguanylate cyclase [Bacillota bacterium]